MSKQSDNQSADNSSSKQKKENQETVVERDEQDDHQGSETIEDNSVDSQDSQQHSSPTECKDCCCNCSCQQIFGSDLNEQQVRQAKLVLLLAGILLILAFIFSFMSLVIADDNSIHQCVKFLY
jgi:predicted nucleic acid-binding Zn ribbon protein